MARNVPNETEAVNADSFLDIVASIVSIMIIMVLMTGLKIRHMPLDALLRAGDCPGFHSAKTGLSPSAPRQAALAQDSAREQAARADVLKVAAEIETVQRETAARARERDMLVMAATSLQAHAEGGRRQLGQRSRDEQEVAGKLQDARLQLDEIERQRAAVETAPAPPVQVECYPTPLSRTVDGRELHFRLRAGRIAFIPLDPLVASFKADAEHKVYRLQDSPEMTDTVGPEGGFRLRYTIERHDVAAEAGRGGNRGGTYAQLKRWTLIPVSDELGETVDEALAPGSQFHQALSDRRAKDAAVTVWTYPDSFDAFRRIKKDLYQLGFPVAARPLPDGTPISGSPDGSKSSAE